MSSPDNHLPPPQPMDKPQTRPALDLNHMLNQVRAIQQFLAARNKPKSS